MQEVSLKAQNRPSVSQLDLYEHLTPPWSSPQVNIAEVNEESYGKTKVIREESQTKD